MSSGPEYWNRVIDTQRCSSLLEFQNAIKCHEDSLMSSTMSQDSSMERRLKALELSISGNRNWTFNKSNRRNTSQAQTHLVGYSPSLEPPKWPRDDTVVTKSGRTPEKAGERPCRHCGSPKHWDYGWKYAKQGARRVRVNFVNPSQEYMDAQEAYDNLYYASEDEDNSQLEEDPQGEDSENLEQDFHEPLQCKTFLSRPTCPSESIKEEVSRLGGIRSFF